MDYEKMYKEALERARKALDKIQPENQGVIKLIKDAFPELAESEDERIRKELIGALMWQRDCLDAKGPHDNNLILPGFTMKVGDILRWLEKQKELDKMIVVSPEVWDNAISDAYENGKKDSEKQKENPEEPKIAFGDWGDKEKQEAIFTCLKYMRFIKKITNQEYNDLTEWLDSNLVYPLNLKKRNEDVAKLCSNEWSEEDEKRVKQLIYDTEAIRAGYEKRKESLGDDFNDELIKDCDEQINWLKSLRPSWKPSEEHLSALLAVFNDPDNIGSQTCQLALTDLYEQLKKL